jgi:WASH complex subunit 7
VNFTYQFLAQKFHIFSQFLFDDYISSNLSKEKRWFKKNRVGAPPRQ